MSYSYSPLHSFVHTHCILLREQFDNFCECVSLKPSSLPSGSCLVILGHATACAGHTPASRRIPLRGGGSHRRAVQAGHGAIRLGPRGSAPRGSAGAAVRHGPQPQTHDPDVHGHRAQAGGGADSARGQADVRRQESQRAPRALRCVRVRNGRLEEMPQHESARLFSGEQSARTISTAEARPWIDRARAPASDLET